MAKKIVQAYKNETKKSCFYGISNNFSDFFLDVMFYVHVFVHVQTRWWQRAIWWLVAICFFRIIIIIIMVMVECNMYCSHMFCYKILTVKNFAKVHFTKCFYVV